MIFLSQCGLRLLYVVVIVVFVASDCLYHPQNHAMLFVSASRCLVDTSYVCGMNSPSSQQSAAAVVQVTLPPCLAGSNADDYGGAALSVDWGEDPTMFQYDTVTVNYETGRVITDLPLWNNTDTSDNTTTMMVSDVTSYHWNWNQSTTNTNIALESDQRQTLTILHTYTQPGRYWPIHRSVGLNSNLSLTEWESMWNTCKYQPTDATTNSGSRNESQCGLERPRIDIGTDGSCTIVHVTTSSSSHLVFKHSSVFSTSMLLVVVGLVAACGF